MLWSTTMPSFAYHSVAAWLDDKDKMPDKIAKIKGLTNSFGSKIKSPRS